MADRNDQPDRTGLRRELICRPVEPCKWQVDPWPLGGTTLQLELPCKSVLKSDCRDQASLAAAFAAAKPEMTELHLV